MNDLIGRRIADFLVLERIGRGGMATVYRARQESMAREIALKVLPFSAGAQPAAEGEDFARRFAQEARVIAALEHIHILPVIAYGIEPEIEGGLAYLAMRLLRGGTLNLLLKQEGALSLERSIDIFTQAGRGLAYAHGRGIVHRDVKPGNIMFDDEGNVFITDFGLAKLIGGDETDLTRPDNIVGTPYYMSPEQLRGDPLDQRSDLYSMGVVLYEMLTGQRPFDLPSSDVVPIIYKHLEEVPQPPHRVNPAVPMAVSQVVMRSLEKLPAHRYPDMLTFVDALRESVGLPPASTGELPAVPLSRPALLRPRKPLRVEVIPALLMVLAVVAVLGLLLAGDDITRSQPANSTAGPLPTATAFTLPLPTVTDNRIARPIDVVPSSAEIALAQRVVGETGFIALVACNLSSEYHATIAREISQFARAYALPVEVYDADTDAYTQATLIERARADGAAGLIVCPIDIDLLDEPLAAVDADGLPLVLFSADDARYGGVALMGDDFNLGYVPGSFAGEIANREFDGRPRVLILDFPSLPHLIERADGLEAGLLEVAPEAIVIGRYLGATRDNGYASVQRLLAQGTAFDMILSINDAGAIGAIDALAEAGIPPEAVAVVGVDAEAQARQYIARGYYMRGTVSVARTLAAQVMVDSMVRLLAGGVLPGRVLIPAGAMVTQESLAGTPAAP